MTAVVSPKTLKLGIADKQKFVHDSIRLMSLQTPIFFEIKVNVYTCDELEAALKETEIDVLVIDADCPLEKGKQICNKIRQEYPDLKIIVFCHSDDRLIIGELYQLFAHSYIEKTESLDTLIESIREVACRGVHYRYDLSEIFQKVDKQPKKNEKIAQHYIPVFSKQDIEIARLAQLEFTTAEIAKKLKLKVKTVEKHRTKMMLYTSSKKMVGVINYMIQHGILNDTAD